MKNDPFYLSEEASLGVLSADENLYTSVSTFFEFNFNLIKHKAILNDNASNILLPPLSHVQMEKCL